jgi:hypothetical protein
MPRPPPVARLKTFTIPARRSMKKGTAPGSDVSVVRGLVTQPTKISEILLVG